MLFIRYLGCFTSNQVENSRKYEISKWSFCPLKSYQFMAMLNCAVVWYQKEVDGQINRTVVGKNEGLAKDSWKKSILAFHSGLFTYYSDKAENCSNVCKLLGRATGDPYKSLALQIPFNVLGWTDLSGRNSHYNYTHIVCYLHSSNHSYRLFFFFFF